MAISYFMNTDAGAPTLTGQVGSLIALLDACLVTGYGSKTALGWTKPFTGTNKAVFRMSAAGGKNGHYLRVLDDGSCTDGAARTASLLGYVSMTDVDTGVDVFPATYQRNNSQGMLLTKSTTLDAVARPWVLAGDDTFFYFYSWTEQTTFASNTPGGSPRLGQFGFGQIDSRVPNDLYGTIIMGRNNDAYNGTSYQDAVRVNPGTTLTIGNSKYVLARDYLGLSAAKLAGLCNATLQSGGTALPIGNGEGIDSATGKLIFGPTMIKEVYATSGFGLVRGTCPLIFGFDGNPGDPSTSTILRYMDIIPGQGTYAGSNFLVISMLNNSTVYPSLLQISGERIVPDF